MTFSELFDSGFKKRNQDHFAAIVRIAMDDNVITEEEKGFLDRLARKLDILKLVYDAILEDYKSHPINPPITSERRLERLFDLARMVYADHIKDEHEVLILTKIAVGLGYKKTQKILLIKPLILWQILQLMLKNLKKK